MIPCYVQKKDTQRIDQLDQDLFCKLAPSAEELKRLQSEFRSWVADNRLPTPKRDERQRMKLLHFHENTRPAYYGTNTYAVNGLMRVTYFYTNVMTLGSRSVSIRNVVQDLCNSARARPPLGGPRIV